MCYLDLMQNTEGIGITQRKCNITDIKSIVHENIMYII